MPQAIAGLAEEFLTDPVRVSVTPAATTADRVTQSVTHVKTSGKQELLHSLLQDSSISRALVFTRTKHGANRVVARLLLEAKIKAEAIHGNKSQAQRERALKEFRNGKARLLIATDIAARGIDIDDVTHVINFDLPDVPEQYVHRIGRTARAGNGGIAISFCAPEESTQLRDIERLLKIKVPATNAALHGEARPARPHGRPHAHKNGAHKNGGHHNNGGGEHKGGRGHPRTDARGPKRHSGPPHGAARRKAESGAR
jgi:ATP-dependent RNA helicase RhlE